MGKQWKQWQTLFSWAPKSLQMVTAAVKVKDASKKSYDKPRERIKKQRHHFANKGPYNQSYGFYSNHGQMWELDHREGWVLNNWCFQTVVLEKTLDSPLDCKKIQPVNPKGNQPWIFTGRTDAKAEIPILWPPDVKNWLIEKDPDAGKDWRQEETGTTEDEMVGWHHRLKGHEFEQAPGVGDEQGGLVCCSPWGCKEWDTTEWLNWTSLERAGLTLATMKLHWDVTSLESASQGARLLIFQCSPLSGLGQLAEGVQELRVPMSWDRVAVPCEQVHEDTEGHVLWRMRSQVLWRKSLSLGGRWHSCKGNGHFLDCEGWAGSGRGRAFQQKEMHPSMGLTLISWHFFGSCDSYNLQLYVSDFL